MTEVPHATEVRLPGGFVTPIVRVGNTVRRLPPAGQAFVHDLLVYLRRCGWDGAPAFLGVDEQGREVLSFVEGHVAWEPEQPAGVTSAESLARVAELVREFHTLTAGSPLAGDEEVVCHNDLSPKNTVYRDLGGGPRPVAFIDWDIAAPGERIHDVAHVCWQYLNLGPEVADVAAAGRGIRTICEAYGLADRSRVLPTVLWWQDRCWRGIEAQARAGVPAMARLRDTGAARSVREARRWVARHREDLEAVLL